MPKLRIGEPIYIPCTIERIIADGNGNFHVYVGGLSYKVNTLNATNEFETKDFNPIVIIIDNQPVIMNIKQPGLAGKPEEVRPNEGAL